MVPAVGLGDGGPGLPQSLILRDRRSTSSPHAYQEGFEARVRAMKRANEIATMNRGNSTRAQIGPRQLFPNSWGAPGRI